MEKIVTLDAGSKEIAQWVYREKVKMLFSNHRQSWILSLLVAAIIAYLSHESDNLLLGISWWLVFAVITLSRAWLTFRFFKSQIPLSEYATWCHRFLVMSMLAGIGWGAGGLLIGSTLDEVSQIFILLILIGLCAAAVPLLGVIKEVMLVFQLPTTLPYIIWSAFQMQEKGILLAMIYTLFLIGILVAIRRVDTNISDSLRMQYEMEQLADSLSQSNQKLLDTNEKLEHMTLRDTLTQLNNRRYFEGYLDKEWKRAARHDERLTMLVIDVDYFKLFNDTYGHAEGDACLRKIANILSQSVHRPGDAVARIGGEEFVILLPGIDDDGAQTVAENIQQQLEQDKLPHQRSPVSEWVTVSIGIAAACPARGATALALFKAADKALYQGKSQGRNLIVMGVLDDLDLVNN